MPGADYFLIPVTFWQYGLDKELGDAQTAAYFICLYEQARQWPLVYWSLGFENILAKYHMPKTTLSAGFIALEKMNLIQVWRTPPKPGASYGEHEANKYRLKPLLSPQEKTRRWQKMERKYGKEKVNIARELAAVLDKENDFDAVTDVIILLNEYGEPLVREKVNSMATMVHNNAARNTYYLKVIVKNAA